MTRTLRSDALSGEENKGRAGTRRYEAKREAILRSAVELFNMRGVKGTSLSDVAQSVGLATNSVTYYCRKKDDLAVACYLRAIEAHDDIFRQAAAGPDVRGRVKLCVDLYLRFLADVALGKQTPVIFFDDIRTLSEEHSAPVFRAYTDMFRRARALFMVDGADEPSRVALNARTHLLLSVLFWVPAWMYRYEPEDYGRVASRINDILINGLTAPGYRWSAPESEEVEAVPQEGEEVSRQAFLRSASELINDQGYLGASVDRISARLNVTKGSFYHHNHNKDDLVVDCFEHSFEVVRRAQNDTDRFEADGWTKLCAVTVSLIRYQMSPSGPLLRTTALHAVPELIRRQMAIRMNRISDRFGHFIVDGMSDGSIRPVDPVVAGHLINPMINGASDLARWAPGLGVDQTFDYYIRPLFVGLARADKESAMEAS